MLITYSKDHQVHAARALVVLSLLIFVSVLGLVVGACTARTEQSSAQLFWPPPNLNGGLGDGQRGSYEYMDVNKSKIIKKHITLPME